MLCYCDGQCTFDGPGICTVSKGGKCFSSVSVEIEDNGIESSVNYFGCLSANIATLQVRSLYIILHIKYFNEVYFLGFSVMDF